MHICDVNFQHVDQCNPKPGCWQTKSLKNADWEIMLQSEGQL